MKLAIVGAGVAGLAAAHALRQTHPDLELVVVEKSRGVGGRAATRRSNNATFDHGAQYVKTPTAALEQFLCNILPHDTLVDIAQPIWTFDAMGTITAGDPSQNAEPKWTYRDGLTQLAKELARDIPIRLQTRAKFVAQAATSFELYDERDTLIEAADAILLTPPAPQTYDLIKNSRLPETKQWVLLEQLATVPYRRCLSLTFGFDPVLQPRPWYALVNSDKQHPISWLAYEHMKPGRTTVDQHIVIAQMAPDWSQQHWDDPLPVATSVAVDLFSELLREQLPTPRWSDQQRWRYALPDGCADFDRLNTTLPGLFFAGDHTAGQGRVHLAIEQGWRVAERIVSFLGKHPG